MHTFPAQVQAAYDASPGCVRMEVYANFAFTLTADVPCAWTTIPDAVILCYDANGTILAAFSVSA